MKFHHLALVNDFRPPGRDHNEIQSVLLKLSNTSKVFTWQGNFEEFLLLTNIINWRSFVALSMPLHCSTINPILYNVMSHRYRIAFRETLCGRRRRSQFTTTGYSINQSSFHETTIAEAGCPQENSRLVRIRTKYRVGKWL